MGALMPRPEPICLVLLAAGSATRFGTLKQLVAIDGVAMARHCASAAVQSGARVLVVTGARRNAVEEQLVGLPVTLTFNPGWREGMGSSLALGVRAAQDAHSELRAVIIALADMPSISHRQFRALLDTHARFPERIIAADSGGTLGPPCLFPARYFAELEALTGERGARSVLEKHAKNVHAVAMPEAAIDIDVPADHARYSRPR